MVGSGKPTAAEREQGEDDQRDQHAVRRFVDVGFVLVVARRAKEGEEEQAEHVEGSEQRADDAEEPRAVLLARGPFCAASRIASLLKKPEKTGTPAMARVAANMVQKVKGIFLRRPPMLPHVLLAAHGVNHAAGGEEEQAFEEGVSHQMENAGAEGAHAAGQEHVAKLGDRGIGENFLDVGLNQADGGGVKGGERADDGDDEHSGGGVEKRSSCARPCKRRR